MIPFFLGGAFVASLGLSLVLTYLVRSWATRRGFVDRPDGVRRLHPEPIPNVGGTAIVLSTLGAFLLTAFFLPSFPASDQSTHVLAMLAGGFGIFLVGFWDDVRNISPATKFTLQTAIAVAVFAVGVRISGVTVGDVSSGVLPLWASLGVTVLWLVGTTNAFNLIDGGDGLAAGAALFASASLAVVFALNADPLGALMALTLTGACLGFLFFNFPPASIFLGDSGSLFLGFTLAALGVITTHTAPTVLAVAIPIVAFGLPLLDTMVAMVRRFLRREPIYKADRGHIHHRLRDLGHSPRKVALLAYGVCAGFAALSLLLTRSDNPSVLPVFIIAGAILAIGLSRLNIPELAELQRVVGRGFQQRMVIAHNVRVQEASAKLAADGAGSSEIFGAFYHAFFGAEFDRIELWVPEDLAAGLSAVRGDLTRSADGCLWKWELCTVDDERQLLEIRVPLFGSEDRAVGRLSLFRRSDRERLFTDVRLLSTHFGPALMRALLVNGAEDVPMHRLPRLELVDAPDADEMLEAIEDLEPVRSYHS